MLDQEKGTLRSVAWSELLPWLIIFRCFRLAIRHQMLMLSAVAALLTTSGWALFGYVLSGSPQPGAQVQPAGGNPWLALSGLVPNQPFGTAAAGTKSASLLARESGPVAGLFEPVYGTWAFLARPWQEMFAIGLTWTNLTYLLLCGLWVAVVWAFFGAAVTRMAAVELAAEERIGWGAMLKFARSKWLAFLTAPLMSLLFVLAITVPIAVVSLLLRLGIGVTILGFVWWLLLAGGVVMAILLLGLLFGWPLMWPTIATEGTDGFDAWSRAYSYTFERPLHYLFYAAVAFGFGIVGWLLVANFTAGVVQLTYWAANWGGGAHQIQSIASGAGDTGLGSGLGVWLIRRSVEVVKLLAVGFLFSYFWSASTAIYLLMRRQVDATEMDEVSLDDDDEVAYGLPPLKTDGEGVPTVGDEGAPQDGENGESES